MIRALTLFTLGFCLFLITSCSKNDADSQTKKDSSDSAVSTEQYGIIKETMNSGGYTYALIKTDKKEIWAAVPMTKLKTGDTVLVPAGRSMPNYHSKTLDRTFDDVLFTSAISLKNGQNHKKHTMDAHKGMAGNAPAGHDSLIGKSHTKAKKTFKITGIKKPEGGKTISEIFSEKEKLFGKEVLFRGKIVKANFKILGTNWYHFQDGTGDAESNDLTVTSDAKAELGQVAVVKGILVKNKDFGSGYKYPVIIEKADLSVE